MCSLIFFYLFSGSETPLLFEPGKSSFSNVGPEFTFSQMVTRLQKSAHGSFLLTVMLFTHVHRLVEQLR